MTFKIKINCDLWATLAFYTLMGLGVLAWAGVTIGLIYGEYFFILNWIEYPKSDIVIMGIILGMLSVANIVNLYYVSRTIYNNQTFIEFECTSSDCK